MGTEMRKRPVAPLDLIPAALEKTGFILEHAVAEEFKKAGWSTIGGRYYADDLDGQARELDLVAYRTLSSADIDVVTGVLVSCKKDEETTWAFLTRKRPKLDPNHDWDPVHYWTDVQPLQLYLAHSPWKDAYLKALGENYSSNLAASQDTFAFQQVSIGQKPVPKNDRAIFSSIVSLMKALDHEKESLTSRMKGKKRIYVFSLLSVVDASMAEVSYSAKDAIATETGRLTHLARYMVRKRDVVALIHFVRADVLPSYLSALTKFADDTAKHMIGLAGSAYEAVRTSPQIREYFSKKLASRLNWRIGRSIREAGMQPPKIEAIELDYVKDTLVINVYPFDEDQIEVLNQDKQLMAETRQALNEIARYKGNFKFDCDIPF